MERIVYEAVRTAKLGKGDKEPRYSEGQKYLMVIAGGYVTLAYLEKFPRRLVTIYANNFSKDFREAGYVNEQTKA